MRKSIGDGNYVKISSVNDVVKEIKKYYKNNGQKPFTLVILEHGSSDHQGMGSVATFSDFGQFIRLNDPRVAGDLKAFTDACKESKVTSCHLGGCNVGSPPNGPDLLQKFATDGNMKVTAWDGIKSIHGDGWFIHEGSKLVEKPDP